MIHLAVGILFLFLFGCETPRAIDDYAKLKEAEIREARMKNNPSYQTDLNTLLDNFTLFNPTGDAIDCMVEYQNIIEKYKKVKLTELARENLLILCQRMIWDEQKNPHKSEKSGKRK